MQITLTKDQYDEMENLATAMATIKMRTANSDGELQVNTTKVEWDSDEVKFTLSD